MENNDLEAARFLEQSYKKEEARSKIMFFNKDILSYDEKNSTWLWATYESKTQIVLAIHGFDTANVSFAKLLSDRFFNNNENNELLEKFCRLHLLLKRDNRQVFITSHSLGCWIVAKCEVRNGGGSQTGIMFAPYALGDNQEVLDFMANTSRFKKVFYDNDPVAKILLKQENLTNAIIFTPKTQTMTFINSHALFNFLKPLNIINADLKTKKKPSDIISHELDKPKEEEKKEEDQTITLKVLSYNVKMFGQSLSDLKNEFRANKIVEKIIELNPELIAFQELFDEKSAKIMKKGLGKAGYFHSKLVGDNPNIFSGKLINGGVMLFSKFQILDQKIKVFRQATKDDDLASKGVARITINKDGKTIHFLGLHGQSGRKEEAFKVKESQFDDLGKLTGNKEPTIVVGDFNIAINRKGSTDFFDKQTEKIGLTRISPTEGTSVESFSKKRTKNILDHLLHNDNEGFEISVETQVLKNFVVEGGFKFREKGLFTLRKRQTKRLKRLFRKGHLTKKEKGFNLSDHLPVLFNVKIEYN